MNECTACHVYLFLKAHKEELAMMERAEEEFQRREIIRERKLKQDSAKKQKQEQDKERRCVVYGVGGGMKNG